MSIVSMEMSTVPMSHSVSYSCTFKNKWSPSRQPVGYPFDAHWSPPVIAAHGRWRMWARNRNATDGVVQVAEVRYHVTLFGTCLEIEEHKPTLAIALHPIPKVHQLTDHFFNCRSVISCFHVAP